MLARNSHCTNHRNDQLSRPNGVRPSTRSIVGMLEQQPGVFFVDTDGVIDDRWLTGMIDECSGQIAEES